MTFFDAIDVAHWLSRFSERPITGWGSLLLWKAIDTEARGRIMRGSASLIDVRNYLFARLSHLLLRMGQPHKVARRMYYFLHSIANEMKILEVRADKNFKLLFSDSCFTFFNEKNLSLDSGRRVCVCACACV